MMLPPSTLFVLFSTALLMTLSPSQAFTSTRRTTAAPGRSIQGVRYQPKSSSKGRSNALLLASILKMSSNGGDEREKGKILDDGNFYDDEIDTEPIKAGISDSMKARLTREASSGLDSEKAQTNTILYISVIVVALVALAGGGILF